MSSTGSLLMRAPALQTGTRRGSRLRDWLVPALGLVAFGVATYLYQNYPRIYSRIPRMVPYFAVR